VTEPTVDEFLDGFLRPMVKRQETQVLRLRGELRRAEFDLDATQRVIEILRSTPRDERE
jgi:hypothetical protein